MAKSPPKKAELPQAHAMLHVAVVVPSRLAAASREHIDVVPEWVDYKIAALNDSDLTDAIGSVKDTRKELDKWEKLAVGIIKARLKAKLATGAVGEGTFGCAGKKYAVEITTTSRSIISVEKLRAKFTEAELADCYTDSEVDTLKAIHLPQPAAQPT